MSSFRCIIITTSSGLNIIMNLWQKVDYFHCLIGKILIFLEIMEKFGGLWYVKIFILQYQGHYITLVADILTNPPLPPSILSFILKEGSCFSILRASLQCNLTIFFSGATMVARYLWGSPSCTATSCLWRGFPLFLPRCPQWWSIILQWILVLVRTI